MDRATKQSGQAEPAEDADERDVVLGWLAFHRDALARNCAGLSPDQLVLESAPPSDLTLLGLVRHLTEMERWYLTASLSGRDLPDLYCTPEDDAADIVGLDASMVDDSFDHWYAEIASVDALLAELTLDDPTASGGSTVRWCVLKVVEEYARHNGHADLIRERIDGAVGE
ncbi:protein of unknown function DUF664 [Beutenbergia cavernae DSM 12333]|uniref:Mini-circle protein n=1 Tax=Beutenbergia cavernae (strain ATCC BAA-8 / DSM 12333 / CCUG 43141 / JCM 11478 / NBRC 16432 / NCIMB 13614 / HKI 0122) TaxID=471853 RepID=C5C0D6_BEUC1|nr:DinB family protein [Beutenbergia cavernae]ACQ79322.1 protein of unknown function DUF664 [Beutenbergia cavernae DSM 12333]